MDVSNWFLHAKKSIQLIYFPLCVLTVESTGAFPILEASQVILEQPLSVLEYTATLELVSSEQN